MKDLKKESGLEVILKGDFKLELAISLSGGEFSSRTIRDMKNLWQKKIEPSDDPVYFMYRDVRQRIDDQKIKQFGLRFDLTVVLPKMLGREFNKTYGHYHPGNYPEAYEVISGKALYLLQKPSQDGDEVSEAYLVEVRAGEKVIMPPHFGHVTINPSNEPLVMSNWVSDDFESLYDNYEKHRGGAFYLVKSDDNSDAKILKNKHYHKLPRLIRAKPRELSQFGLKFNLPLYSTGVKNIGRLKYLIHPEDFMQELKPEKLFVL